ncbi:sulfotransferase family 2 domain-containing protein [Pseudooceanicola pacificus]|uniref:sulfotransferase family 2 domain-containing protein n=1 Tax=Pseudooceanicola pacificus TaxID=2676438 RepID=UPI00136657CB|nr:sulfotransferase family 2 domain-containing protein [Pseudooceanicola pacificus]
MLSRDHRTIFVHIPKTAGQCIASAFLTSLGLTWDERSRLLMRYNDDPRVGPERLAHLFAGEYLDCGHVSAEEFRTFFKFSIVRNPFDRVISAFNYRQTAGSRDRSIRDYVRQQDPDPYSATWRHFCPQHLYVHRDGQVIVDRIIRHEALSAEWPGLCEQVFGHVTPLPRWNITRNRIITRDSLSSQDRDFILEAYRDDFIAFGYDTAV